MMYRNTHLKFYKKSPEIFHSVYVNKDNDNLVYDDNFRKVDLYNYKLVREIYLDAISVITECSNSGFEVVDDIGESWIRDKITKLEYSFSELEIIFTPLFAERDLVFSAKTMDKYFPPFTRKRKTKNKIKQTYYAFE